MLMGALYLYACYKCWGWSYNKMIPNFGHSTLGFFLFTGLTLLKYYNPPNFTYPDEVSIVNVSDVEFRPVNRHGLVESSGTGKFVSRLLGSVRVPIDPGKRDWLAEKMSACVDYASMLIQASRTADGELEMIQVSFLPVQRLCT